jgi:O-antigen ligase
MAVWIGPDPVLVRFELLETQAEGVGGRWAIWQDTLRLIQQHLWLGTGLGTFPVAYPAVQTVHLNRFVNHAHNDYLEVASEIGVLGAAVLFGSILYTFVALIRRVGRNQDSISRATGIGATGALVAILCHSLTDFNLYIPANALVFSVVLGLGYLTSQPEIERPPSASEDRGGDGLE